MGAPVKMPGVSVAAVIFDWGGTLTPWHTVDHLALWRAVAARHHGPQEADAIGAAIRAAELDAWTRAETEQRSTTLGQVLEQAGIAPTDQLLASYASAWDPHTYTDPDVPALLTRLRERGIRIGVLSNTIWTRERHEAIFRRDGVLDLIDGAVYSSEIPWTKPHPGAFTAAMEAVGVSDPRACVFVGDRPFDDVHGAQAAGMRAVLVPHSDVPSFPGATPDAVISRLADLGPLIDTW